MQAGPESNWGSERHPVQQSFMPWSRGSDRNPGNSALAMAPEKDIRLFQSTSSNGYDSSRKNLFSELPASVTYLPNTSYNKSSQSLSTTKYGSHVRKIQNLLQEMEQDEEQRLAQIRRDSLLLNPNYNQQSAWSNNDGKKNFLPLPTNRSGSLARHKSSPGLNSAYTYELQGQNHGRLSLSEDQRTELEAPYEVRYKNSSGMGDLKTLPTELEVPGSIRNNSLAELDVPNTVLQSHGRSQSHINSQSSTPEDPMSSFADLDVMISNARSFYNGHRSSQGSGRNNSLSSQTSRSHRSSRSTIIELDATPLSLVAELPAEVSQPSPVEQRNTHFARYGDRKFRTLPGEAYPLMEREPAHHTEQPLQTKTRTRKQSLPPPVPSKTGHSIQPNIDPRTGLPYTGT